MSEALSAEERDLLALHLVPGLGPRLTSALLERFGSPAGALRATAAQLQEVAGRLAPPRRNYQPLALPITPLTSQFIA